MFEALITRYLHFEERMFAKRRPMHCKEEGIAGELYCAIANGYASSRQPVKVSGKWEPITKYLEIKGFIITHESECGDLFAVPTTRYRA